MKKSIITLLAAIGLSGFSSGIKAQEFFDTSDPDKFFTMGARMGFNTSNRTFGSGNYTNFMMSTWGTGFNAGIVANLNFKEYLSIQPGIFYESRSSNLLNIVDYHDNVYNSKTYYEKDHWRGYYFTIPVMGIVKFNLAENVKWSVEFGPYLQMCIKETGQNNVELLYLNGTGHYDNYTAKHRGYDFGLKTGMGLTLWQHYYVGFHYMAGLCNVWTQPPGGRNKSWVFTAGYDF